MSEDPNPKPRGKLLSKVVKFITSPTVDWSDLDREQDSKQPNESSAALREMIERKRRNDFVRNREFDALRKIRRRQRTASGSTGQGAVATDLGSFISSAESVPMDERAQTIKKIDAIEAEMSDVWLNRKAPDPTPAEPERGYEKTEPSPLHAGGANAPVDVGFTPTTEADERLPLRSGETAPTPLEDVPAPAPAPESSDWMQVDGPTSPPIAPEIEEVAIRFANGDTAGAESGLLDLLSGQGSHRENLETWLTLFDLYRTAGMIEKFDDAAFAFVEHFGRSAPQWELAASPPSSGSAPIAAQTPLAAPSAASTEKPAHWTAPGVIGTQSIATLNAVLTRSDPPWRIDWRRVKAIEPAALPGLVQVFERWAQTPVRIKFLGDEELLGVLAEQSPTAQPEIDRQWWMARLALLRVMSEVDEFELVALNYCVTYEMSPPAWEEPKCQFNLMTDSGVTLPPPEAGHDPTVPPTDLGAVDSVSPALTAADRPGVAQLALEGEILDDATSALKPLVLQEGTRVIEFNCRKLKRVDFGGAGSLLNWTSTQQGQGRQVVFRHVNRLVAAFFSVIGITESARVLRRVD